MGSACCHVALPSGAVQWYSPESTESLDLQTAKTGFGQGRGKPFRSGAITKVRYNRDGNRHGELAGNLIFYRKACEDTRYDDFARKPFIKLGRHVKVFSKGFFLCPLGRMPIGMNNIPTWRVDLEGQGQTLLATCPRAIALFVDIDNRPQTQEHFCEESATHARKYYKTLKLEKAPVILNRAIEGSFVTFMVAREQDQFSFLHIPIVATFNDCAHMETGDYGKTTVKAFTELFSNLTPGKHRLDIRILMYYDHCEFNYFPMGKNINAQGLWHNKLDNSDLLSPHEDPQKYFCSQSPVASGTCFVDIPAGYGKMVEGTMDRKPPKWVYSKNDSALIIADAKTVATGHFCLLSNYGVEGIPDAISLTTSITERRCHHIETGYRYRYEFIEFVAMWLHASDTSDNAEGIMLEGCMARGETTPRTVYRSWAWLSRRRHGDDLIPQPLPVKNKYIRAFLVLQKITLDKEAQANKELKEESKGLTHFML